jgi:hypothetical protein
MNLEQSSEKTEANVSQNPCPFQYASSGSLGFSSVSNIFQRYIVMESIFFVADMQSL